MPDLASLFSSASPLAGLVSAAGVAPATGTTDTGNTANNGGFQAMLEQQASQLASNPVVTTLLPPLALASAITLGGPATSTATATTGNAALPDSGNVALPDTGKILPDSLAGLAGDASDQDETPAIDPAVMLMLNGGVQPALPPATTPDTPSAQAAIATAPTTQQAIAQRVVQTAMIPTSAPTALAQTTSASLAVAADAAKAAAAETTAITIEPQDSAPATAPSVELRPVVGQSAAQQQGAQQQGAGDAQSDTGQHGQTSSSDPQALAATDDAARAAHPPTPGLVEASAGAVQTPLATAATDAPANSIHAVAPTTRTDMADLVDRLVEARQAARMSGPQSVVASVAHSSFGRITLDFKQDDKGLSVAMTSSDPGFAPAAQAALAQQQVSATNTGNEAGNSQSNTGSGNQSDPRQTYFTRNDASQSGGQFSGSQSGNGQNSSARWAGEAGIAANPSQPTAQGDTASHANGILA